MGHDSLSALLDLHQLCFQRLVLAELAKAVSDHDAPPPGLDPHLRKFCEGIDTLALVKKEKLFHGALSGKEEKERFRGWQLVISNRNSMFHIVQGQTNTSNMFFLLEGKGSKKGRGKYGLLRFV